MAEIPHWKALAALQDVRDNDGMMWRAKDGIEAAILWKDLRRRGWVKGREISDAGNKVLEEEPHA